MKVWCAKCGDDNEYIGYNNKPQTCRSCGFFFVHSSMGEAASKEEAGGAELNLDLLPRDFMLRLIDFEAEDSDLSPDIVLNGPSSTPKKKKRRKRNVKTKNDTR